MGAAAGAFAAAATTPLDVIKTNMMCTAASRPTMVSSARTVLTQGGPASFFRWVPCVAVHLFASYMYALCNWPLPAACQE